jgi:hypothetical protein
MQLSSRVSGAIDSDWTHAAPPHVAPASISSKAVHPPSQSLGGSNGVLIVVAPGGGHVASFARMVAGSAHAPVNGADSLQSQAPHVGAAMLGSPKPSKPSMGAWSGQAGT